MGNPPALLFTLATLASSSNLSAVGGLLGLIDQREQITTTGAARNKERRKAHAERNRARGKERAGPNRATGKVVGFRDLTVDEVILPTAAAGMWNPGLSWPGVPEPALTG
ncbi:MAG: hypothetical protein NWT04_10185 [Verrucomicrobiales bacterium]|nr:hypothetical protein [Verrucomicrobiales bacterium]MDP4638469.1 hypothetical protein [Verrucomicrobiales bacterium]MDP4791281.1 hypothetical protein [Verrucomicrobiales bacterium]MDP5006070.1 hypothetical protein [Verrucomicrobiales bacterium]